MEDDSDDIDVDDIVVSDMCNRYLFFYVVVFENDVFLVSKLIKEDFDCVYEIGYRKRIVLYLVVLEGKVELVKFFFWYGVNRIVVDCYYFLVIVYVLDGYLECV